MCKNHFFIGLENFFLDNLKMRLCFVFVLVMLVFSSMKSTAQLYISFSFWQKYVQPEVYVFTANDPAWAVPLNWNSTNNSIECIGGGGGGSTNGGNGGSGGGGGSNNSTYDQGCTGGAGTDITTTGSNVGSGGGGGGSGEGSSTVNNGGNAGNYGGGGGGVGRQSSGSSVGSGAQGVCVIKFTPS